MDSDNPYSPPRAAVADTDTVVPRPSRVTRAVVLLWVALPFMAAREILDLWSAAPEFIDQIPVLLATLIVAALMLVVWLVIVWGVAKGKRWARIACAVVFLVRIVSFIRFLPSGETTLEWTLYAVEFALVLAAVILLFTPPANAWFRPAV
jgi:hypothetical protein